MVRVTGLEPATIGSKPTPYAILVHSHKNIGVLYFKLFQSSIKKVVVGRYATSSPLNGSGCGN